MTTIIGRGLNSTNIHEIYTISELLTPICLKKRLTYKTTIGEHFTIKSSEHICIVRNKKYLNQNLDYIIGEDNFFKNLDSQTLQNLELIEETSTCSPDPTLKPIENLDEITIHARYWDHCWSNWADQDICRGKDKGYENFTYTSYSFYLPKCPANYRRPYNSNGTITWGCANSDSQTIKYTDKDIYYTTNEDEKWWKASNYNDILNWRGADDIDYWKTIGSFSNLNILMCVPTDINISSLYLDSINNLYSDINLKMIVDSLIYESIVPPKLLKEIQQGTYFGISQAWLNNFGEITEEDINQGKYGYFPCGIQTINGKLVRACNGELCNTDNNIFCSAAFKGLQYNTNTLDSQNSLGYGESNLMGLCYSEKDIQNIELCKLNSDGTNRLINAYNKPLSISRENTIETSYFVKTVEGYIKKKPSIMHRLKKALLMNLIMVAVTAAVTLINPFGSAGLAETLISAGKEFALWGGITYGQIKLAQVAPKLATPISKIINYGMIAHIGFSVIGGYITNAFELSIAEAAKETAERSLQPSIHDISEEAKQLAQKANDGNIVNNIIKEKNGAVDMTDEVKVIDATIAHLNKDIRKNNSYLKDILFGDGLANPVSIVRKEEGAIYVVLEATEQDTILNINPVTKQWELHGKGINLSRTDIPGVKLNNEEEAIKFLKSINTRSKALKSLTKDILENIQGEGSSIDEKLLQNSMGFVYDVIKANQNEFVEQIHDFELAKQMQLLSTDDAYNTFKNYKPELHATFDAKAWTTVHATANRNLYSIGKLLEFKNSIEIESNIFSTLQTTAESSLHFDVHGMNESWNTNMVANQLKAQSTWDFKANINDDLWGNKYIINNEQEAAANIEQINETMGIDPIMKDAAEQMKCGCEDESYLNYAPAPAPEPIKELCNPQELVQNIWGASLQRGNADWTGLDATDESSALRATKLLNDASKLNRATSTDFHSYSSIKDAERLTPGSVSYLYKYNLDQLVFSEERANEIVGDITKKGLTKPVNPYIDAYTSRVWNTKLFRESWNALDDNIASEVGVHGRRFNTWKAEWNQFLTEEEKLRIIGDARPIAVKVDDMMTLISKNLLDEKASLVSQAMFAAKAIRDAGGSLAEAEEAFSDIMAGSKRAINGAQKMQTHTQRSIIQFSNMISEPEARLAGNPFASDGGWKDLGFAPQSSLRVRPDLQGWDKSIVSPAI